MKTIYKLQAHEKPINMIKLNFDGDLLFSASSDRRINLWDSITGERIGSYQTKTAVRCIEITNDSKYLISGQLDGTLEVFEVDGGNHVGSMRKNARIKYIELSYGDKYLLVFYESMGSNNESEIKIYETQKLFQFLKKEKKNDTDNKKLEETNKQDQANEEFCPCFQKFIKEIKFTQIKWGFLNEDLIASTIEGNLIMLSLDGQIKRTEKIHENEIKSFSISKNFSLLLTCSVEGSKVLDPKTLRVLKTFKTDVIMNTGAISPLVNDKINPKYHFVMAGGVSAREAAMTKQGGFEVHLCNIMYEKEVGLIPGHFGPVNTIVFHNDGKGFISGGEEGIIRLHRFDKNYFEDKIYE